MTDTQRERPVREKKKSLITLLSDVPTLVKELVSGEIALLKAEMIRKLKALGIGAGLILAAVVVLLFFIGVLLTAAILGLATIMPGWLAALIVAFVLLVIAAIIGLVGYRRLKLGIPPVPTKTIHGLKKDLNAVKGVGKRATDE
jgi:tetrahydromethanopterin S-methyltransferase subunit C